MPRPTSNDLTGAGLSVKLLDMPAAEITTTQRLATALLGRDVRTWITDRRAEGISWRHIAADLAYETDGQVFVSHETIRNWASEVAA